MRIKRRTKESFFGILFVSPWIIGFLFFTLYPFVQTIIYSFNKVTFPPKGGGVKMQNVGLNNYVQVLFEDPFFLLNLPGFIRDMVLLVPMILVFSIILAMLLNSNIKFRRFFRAIFFLPVIIMSGSLLQNLKTMNVTSLKGMSSFFVYKFIQENVPEMIGQYVLYIFDNVVMFLWFSGVQILIFLSGLQKLDKSMYEAASVDGASSWQKFWKLTLPVMKPFIFLNAIYTVVDISNSSLNPFISFIKLNLYDLKYGFGFASAMIWLYVGVIILAVVLYFLLLGRQQKEAKYVNTNIPKTERIRLAQEEKARKKAAKKAVGRKGAVK